MDLLIILKALAPQNLYMNLGRLAEAVLFYERGNAMDVEMKDWRNASAGYRNLADLQAYLGELATSADAAREALALARRAEDKQGEVDSLGFQAWTAHLLGDLKTSGAIYIQAEALQRDIVPSLRYHYSTDGIKHAEHLRRTGDPAYARRVTEANLEICEQAQWPDDLSRCHRVLGDLDTDEGQHPSAGQHYDDALKIARGISYRPALIEALLARGRWAARQGQAGPARNDLDEALAYALEGGYRIYEADIRVGLAWVYLAAGNPAAARAEASRAQRLSESMGYYWGKVDAEEVLGEIEA